MKKGKRKKKEGEWEKRRQKRGSKNKEKFDRVSIL